MPIGVIGGTGLYKLPGFESVTILDDIVTPWGKPSSPITIARTPAGTHIAFLARHGQGHTIPPSQVPARANIAALRHLGVTTILAFSAVGSLREEIKPRDFILPDQIIDRTRGFRPDSFFEQGLVGHIMFADPFDQDLAAIVERNAHALEGDAVKIHSKRTREAQKSQTLVCMEGPAFSTRAESHLYRSWDGAIINMSALPEAKLAMEAEIQYTMVCMATDYDCWKEGEAVCLEMVLSHLQANSNNAQNLLKAVLPDLENEVKSGKIGQKYIGKGRFTVVTNPNNIDPEVKSKFEYLWGSDAN